ncbi:putative soluble epoxide hydrolase [Helianthus annuus]|uniref:Putative epoxide hydrolase n=1 Tax=Helianthus annuus TaxID=4232 RepID=A0A251U9J5_HELAN|nr:putative soluble epoxide hydrolase [Helianthus annuus]KAJ0549675.1 putative soluble epoxide hydrolase [Helianthus annuus]KAJ0556151.1 putative soluble epoxide hydrolase [Helianthus annuus]KAJ0562630.1 putative soluble epoxide hydrolase [Helianthus annuus]KAJ0728005.1 putative soluble epoxide hydrolase [Helianthus annuus]
MWPHQMLHLPAAGYRTIAPDLRGYGRTNTPTSTADYIVFHIVIDLMCLLDALGLDQVFLVAYDWGASIAWNFCLLRPNRIKVLVNMSVVFRPRNQVRKPIESMRKVFGNDYYTCRFQI